MTPEQIIADLKEGYTGDRFQLDFKASYFLQGEINKQLRQDVMTSLSGKVLSPGQCSLPVIVDALEKKFRQTSLF